MADAPFRERGVCAAIVFHGRGARVGGISGDSRTLTRLSVFHAADHRRSLPNSFHRNGLSSTKQGTFLRVRRQARIPPACLTGAGPRAGFVLHWGLGNAILQPESLSAAKRCGPVGCLWVLRPLGGLRHLLGEHPCPKVFASLILVCFTRSPCTVCGAVMNVRRNIFGPTSFAQAMARTGRWHDRFSCPYREEPWHERVAALGAEARRVPSDVLARIIRLEAADIVQKNMPRGPRSGS